MSKFERTVKIRQYRGGGYPRLSFTGDKAWAGTSPAPTNECSGGGYPRLTLDSPFVIARLASFLAYASEQAPQSQRLPRFARNDKKSGGLAMTRSAGD